MNYYTILYNRFSIYKAYGPKPVKNHSKITSQAQKYICVIICFKIKNREISNLYFSMICLAKYPKKLFFTKNSSGRRPKSRRRQLKCSTWLQKTKIKRKQRSLLLQNCFFV